MRTVADWLAEYGDSHRNPTNDFLHWLCVPVIAPCVPGLPRLLGVVYRRLGLRY